MTDFELERTDIVELATDQVRRAQQQRWRLDVSHPSETVLLTFLSTKPDLKDVRLRQAIAMAIDRASIHNVIFQRQGEVASGFLPNWLTGYAFLFPSTQDTAKGRELIRQLGRVPQITIGYDSENYLDRLIAERIALNVRDIGISMVAVPNRGNAPDIRILHVAVKSLDPAAALAAVLERIGIAATETGDSPQALYNRESAALQTYVAIPLVHLPRITAIKDRVRNWAASPLGEWRFDDLWITSRSNIREGRP